MSTQLKYWIKTITVFCPVCGHEKIYRERVYGEKPENPAERYVLEEGGCAGGTCWQLT
jgi:uncharacterized Zn finger protein (UPF0148 family)